VSPFSKHSQKLLVSATTASSYNSSSKHKLGKYSFSTLKKRVISNKKLSKNCMKMETTANKRNITKSIAIDMFSPLKHSDGSSIKITSKN
jgi:hypothetical protein